MTLQSANTSQRYRFGEFFLSPASRELCRGAEVLTLSPKVFDCILYLIEHRDRAVGRDELIAAVWGRVDVADVQLGQLIRKVRRTLGDDGDEQSGVRTVPRFGFRWVAPLHVDDDSATTTAITSVVKDAQDASARNPADRRGRPVTFAAMLTVAALLAIGAAYWTWHSYQSSLLNSEAGTTSKTTVLDVAVLPVDVTAGDADSAWMRLGLMDLIAKRLLDARVTVVPSDNVIAIAHGSMSAAQIPKQVFIATGARHVVQATALHAPNLWTMRLDLSGSDGVRQTVEAQSPDALSAARQAADRLADLLGGKPPSNLAEPSELFQRIEAALLVDDYESARYLIDGAPEPAHAAAEFRLSAARVDIGMGKFAEATAKLQPLLDQTPAEKDPVLRARILGWLGAATFRSDRRELAEPKFTEAVQLLEVRNEPGLLGKAYVDRGIAEVLGGAYDTAAADFSRARIVLEPTGDRLALARVDLDQGAVEGLRNHYTEALPLFEHAEQVFERFFAHKKLAEALGNEIDAHLQLLQPAAALAVRDRAEAQLGTKNVTVATALSFQIARALVENGRLSEARGQLRALEDAAEGASRAPLLALARGFEAKLDLIEGDPQTAATVSKLAIDELLTPEYAGVRASTWLVRIQALRALHRDTELLTEMQGFKSWADTTNNSAVAVHLRLAEAEQTWALGKHPEAARFYDDALATANREGIPADIAEVVVSYGNALISEGALEQASALIGQVALWTDRDFASALLQARLYHELNQHEAWRKAVGQARALAGERSIPASVAAEPTDVLVSAGRR